MKLKLDTFAETELLIEEKQKSILQSYIMSERSKRDRNKKGKKEIVEKDNVTRDFELKFRGKMKMTEVDIKGLTKDISDFNPNIRIALAKIIPCRNRLYNEKIKELNRWMEEMEQSKRTIEGVKNLFLVDMYAAFINTPYWGDKLMSSRWYPNERGYEVMAREWTRTIKQGQHPHSPSQ